MRALIAVAVAGCAVVPKQPVPVQASTSRAAHADLLLSELASSTRKNRITGAAIMGVQGVLYSSVGAYALASRDDARDPDSMALTAGVALGLGVLCTSVAIYQATTPTAEENVHAQFSTRAAIDATSAVAAAERDLAALADKRRSQRGIVRGIALMVAAAGIGGVVYGKRKDDDTAAALGVTGIVLGGLTALASLAQTPAEKSDHRWQLELGMTARPTASGARTPIVGVRGRF